MEQFVSFVVGKSQFASEGGRTTSRVPVHMVPEAYQEFLNAEPGVCPEHSQV